MLLATSEASRKGEVSKDEGWLEERSDELTRTRVLKTRRTTALGSLVTIAFTLVNAVLTP